MSFEYAGGVLSAERVSLEEIARVTGVGAETAKSRLRYAVGKLKAAMTVEEDVT